MMKMTSRRGFNQKTSNNMTQPSSNFHMHEYLWYMGQVSPHGHVRPRGTSPCLLDGLIPTAVLRMRTLRLVGT